MKKRVKQHLGRKLEFIIGLSLSIFLVFSIFIVNVVISYKSQREYTLEKVDIVGNTILDNFSKTLANIDNVNKTVFLDEEYQDLVSNLYDESLYLTSLHKINNMFERYLTSSYHSIIKDIGYIPRDLNGELDLDRFVHQGYNLNLFGIQESLDINFAKIKEISNKDPYKKGQLFVIEPVEQGNKSNILIFARNIYDIRKENYNKKLGIGFVCVNRLELENILNYSVAIDGLKVYVDNHDGLILKSNSIDQINFDDNKYIKETSSLSFYGWTLYEVYDTNYILKSMMTNIVTEAIVFVVLIIIFIAVYFLLHIRNLKSLYYMFDKFSSNANKKLAIIEYTDDDEINMVIRAYNTMILFNDKLNNEILLEKDKALQSQIQKNEFEIKSLYSQINKHFLINVLSVVHSLINLKEIEKANYCLENLSDFLRYSLNLESEADLKSELNSIVSYFNVQSIRYSKIDYSLTYDDDLDTIIVPKLIIQPLIENAYIHGLKNKKGHIDVTCKRIDDTIYIMVSNYSNEIEKEKIGKVNEELQNIEDNLYENKEGYHGIALINIQRRLKLMYGENANLSIYVTNKDEVVSLIKIKMEN